jgi:hypothetical protein
VSTVNQENLDLRERLEKIVHKSKGTEIPVLLSEFRASLEEVEKLRRD